MVQKMKKHKTAYDNKENQHECKVEGYEEDIKHLTVLNFYIKNCSFDNFRIRDYHYKKRHN